MKKIEKLFYGVPWATTVTHHETLIGILSSADFEKRKVEAEFFNASAEIQGDTAIVPMRGTFLGNSSVAGFLHGLVDAVFPAPLTAEIRALKTNPDVGNVILHVDSLGGEVTGVFELMQAIKELAEVKNVTAVIENAASAAAFAVMYATRRVAVPTAILGSLGTIIGLTDTSELDAAVGVKHVYIRSGDKKMLGAAGEEIDEPVIAEFQKLVDETNDTFYELTADAIGVSFDEAKERFGDGRVLTASEARKLGLIHGTGTLNSVMNKKKYRRKTRVKGEINMDLKAIIAALMGAETLEGEDGEFVALAPDVRKQMVAALEAVEPEGEDAEAAYQRGLTEGAASAPKATATGSSAEISKLVNEVTRLTAELDKTRIENVRKGREAIANAGLKEVAGAKWPEVENYDVKAHFETEVTKAAIAAESDEAASTEVQRLVDEKKIWLTFPDDKKPEPKKIDKFASRDTSLIDAKLGNENPEVAANSTPVASSLKLAREMF